MRIFCKQCQCPQDIIVHSCLQAPPQPAWILSASILQEQNSALKATGGKANWFRVRSCPSIESLLFRMLPTDTTWGTLLPHVIGDHLSKVPRFLPDFLRRRQPAWRRRPVLSANKRKWRLSLPGSDHCAFPEEWRYSQNSSSMCLSHRNQVLICFLLPSHPTSWISPEQNTDTVWKRLGTSHHLPKTMLGCTPDLSLSEKKGAFLLDLR